MGVDPEAHAFVNLFVDPVDTRPTAIRPKPRIDANTVKSLRICSSQIYVALGRRVSTALTKLKIPHVALVHPAARGKIRKRRRYLKHVVDVLGPVLNRNDQPGVKPPNLTPRRSN